MKELDPYFFVNKTRRYLLKIRLLEIEPEIWRKFVVPASISLDRLHDVIQIVMGWQDYHLHEFQIGKHKYTEDPETREEGRDEYRYRLVDIIKQRGRTFRYVYDFGDWWEHELSIEDSHFFSPELEQELTCIDGARACPPEDVGSTPGYYNFCKAVSDPGHEDHVQLTGWYGGFRWYDGIFRSEYFDVDRVNLELAKYLRWSRNRGRYWEIPTN